MRHTCFLATLCSIVAWAPPQTAQQPRPCRLRAAQLDADAYPPAPWSFSNARVMYQPTLVRTSAARAVTPRDGLTLLSFLGWTLGGVFVVDWTALALHGCEVALGDAFSVPPLGEAEPVRFQKPGSARHRRTQPPNTADRTCLPSSLSGLPQTPKAVVSGAFSSTGMTK